MNLFTIATTSFIVAFSGALSPGPLLAVTVDRSLVKGAKEGPLLITGHSILELLLVILLVSGFSTYLKQPVFAKVSGILGGFFLLWMAFNIMQKSSSYLIAKTKLRNFPGSSIFSGIFVSLSNPYWSIWWATIGLTYLSIATPRGFQGITAFFLGHISADFLWYSIVSFSISKGKKKIRPRIHSIISACCGIFLGAFGVFLIVKAII